MIAEIEITGVSSLGVPGVPWHTQIWQITYPYFSQGPGRKDYAYQITIGTPRFSELPKALQALDAKLV